MCPVPGSRWRRDLNPCTRLCRPLPRLSATPPRRPPSGRRDSNPRPSPWQGDALPTALRPHCLPVHPVTDGNSSLGSVRCQTGYPLGAPHRPQRDQILETQGSKTSPAFPRSRSSKGSARNPAQARNAANLAFRRSPASPVSGTGWPVPDTTAGTRSPADHRPAPHGQQQHPGLGGPRRAVPDEVAHPVRHERAARPAGALQDVGVGAHDDVGAGLHQYGGEDPSGSWLGQLSPSCPQWLNTTTTSACGPRGRDRRADPGQVERQRHARAGRRCAPQVSASVVIWLKPSTAIRVPRTVVSHGA